VAVRESEYQFIRLVVTLLKSSVSPIEIKGDNAFKAASMVDLAWLMMAPVGRELIMCIAASGKKLMISPTTSGNSTSYSPDFDSYEHFDGTLGRVRTPRSTSTPASGT
jgi:hypothetical protein